MLGLCANVETSSQFFSTCFFLTKVPRSCLRCILYKLANSDITVTVNWNLINVVCKCSQTKRLLFCLNPEWKSMIALCLPLRLNKSHNRSIISMQTNWPMPSVLLQNQLLSGYLHWSGEVPVFISIISCRTLRKITHFFRGHSASSPCQQQREYCHVVEIDPWERPKKPVGFAFCLSLVRPWAPGDFLVGIIKSYTCMRN